MSSYAIHPGEKLTISFKLMDVVEDLNEGVLQHIVCVIVIFYNIPDLPIESFFVKANELPKSRITTVLILKVK